MENDKRDVFVASLEEAKNLAALQGGVLQEEQIKELFHDLNDQQMNQVYQYLGAVRIGIGEPLALPELTEEDAGYLNLYLEELGELPEVTPTKKKALLMNAMNHDRIAAEELTKVYLGQVVDIARIYLGKGALLEDLIGEGNVALTIALTNLDHQENTEEADTFITKMIMDAMETYLQGLVARYDEDEELLEKINTVFEKAEELSRTMLRKVTVDELTEVCSLSKEEILEVIRITEGAIAYIEG